MTTANENVKINIGLRLGVKLARVGSLLILGKCIIREGTYIVQYNGIQQNSQEKHAFTKQRGCGSNYRTVYTRQA